MSNLVPVPLRDSLERFRRSVLDLFENWLPGERQSGLTRESTFWPTAFFSMGGPAVDVLEDDDSVRVIAELPGLDEKDFSVEVEGSRLLLRGEKKTSREHKDRNCYYSECSYGSFSRVIPLPCDVQADKASATYKKGVLEVVLPKTEEAKSKRIKVQVS